VTTISKKQNLLTKFFSKNKSVESTDHETGLPEAASLEVSIKNTDEGSKAESINSKMSGSRSFRGSCMILVKTLCIVIFAERQAGYLDCISSKFTLLIILCFFIYKF
jgi:hypothetical protein